MTAPFRLTAPLTACLALSAGSPAQAEPIEVTFTPPDMAPQDLCMPRPPNHEVRARWEDWDGTQLGERSNALVRRDLRLLRQADAERWFGTIEQAQTLLDARSESYDDADRMRDRLALLTAAGRVDQIEEEGLAQALVDLAPGSSGSVKVTAAGILSEGRGGVARDEEAALSLLRSAAYEGHPNAIIELASMSASGIDVPDWNIASDVAITMAFGGKIGDADPLVCDRINQIASYYRSGDVVAADHDLAETWYRFSASLGDFNAAWQVARYHMNAEFIDKDNDVLMAHLEQAADGRLTFAMTELAQVLQRGALAERDMQRAMSLYEASADLGDLTAYTRLANMARDTDTGNPEDRARRIEILTEITQLPDPPAWAFAQLSDAVLERDGRWAGEEQAQALIDRALEIDPEKGAALLRDARLQLRYVDNAAEFTALTSDLRAMVRDNGRTEFMQALQRAYHCRAPNAPRDRKAQLWYGAEAFSGDMTITSAELDMSDMGPSETYITMAQLQSQAINERSRSLANLLREFGGGSDDGLGKLVAMSRRSGEPVYSARGLSALRSGDRDTARAWFEQAVAAGEDGAEIDLAKLYADPGIRETRRDEIIRLATEAAHNGSGRAIELLVEVDPEMDAASAWETFAADIERTGDAQALTFALHHLDDADRIEDYIGRIQAVIPCHGMDAVRMANAMTALDRPDRARHWLDVARSTAAGVDWELVAVGDALLANAELYDDPKGAALDLYRASTELDYPLAFRKLLAMRKEGRAEIPLEEATELWTDYIDVTSVEDIPAALKLLRFSDDEIRSAVNERIDVRGLYATAAEQGNPVAQLELAKLVRDGDGASGVARYADLLRASAEQGQDEAMMLLSEAYAYGIGVETDTAKSRAWLERAAEAGNTIAQSRVGLLTNERTSE
jgi:TPR repeat protein